MLRLPAGRGFTLLEILVAISMMVIVGGAVYHTLTVTQRVSLAQAQQVDVQRTVRSAALVLANEFRPLGAGLGPSGSETDLVTISPTAASYRAERGFGVLCRPSGAGRLGLSRVTFTGHRDPQPGRDSVSVFVEGNPESAADDAWVTTAITAAGVGSCPGGEPPGIELAVSPAVAVEGLSAGTPVRVHEIVELRLYSSEGRSWIGMRSVSSGENIQPLAGPVQAGDGLRLDYLAAAGFSTGVRTDVRGVRFQLKGESEGVSHFGAERGKPVTDEVTTQVMLRNAP